MSQRLRFILWGLSRLIGTFAPVGAGVPVQLSVVTGNVFTMTGHGLSTGDTIYFYEGAAGGGLPTPLDYDAIYYASVVDANSFSVSATSGGSVIVLTGSLSGEQYVLRLNGTAPYGDPFSHMLAPVVGQSPAGNLRQVFAARGDVAILDESNHFTGSGHTQLIDGAVIAKTLAAEQVVAQSATTGESAVTATATVGDATGVHAQGHGNGYGVHAIGGSAAPAAVRGDAGSGSNGHGMHGIGDGDGAGVKAVAGGSGPAIWGLGGAVKLDTNISGGGTPRVNEFYADHFAKGWFKIALTGGGVSVIGGINVTATVEAHGGHNYIKVSFKTTLVGNYAVTYGWEYNTPEGGWVFGATANGGSDAVPAPTDSVFYIAVFGFDGANITQLDPGASEGNVHGHVDGTQ